MSITHCGPGQGCWGREDRRWVGTVVPWQGCCSQTQRTPLSAWPGFQVQGFCCCLAASRRDGRQETGPVWGTPQSTNIRWMEPHWTPPNLGNPQFAVNQHLAHSAARSSRLGGVAPPGRAGSGLHLSEDKGPSGNLPTVFGPQGVCMCPQDPNLRTHTLKLILLVSFGSRSFY